MNMERSGKVIETDVVVVGSGIAGAFASWCTACVAGLFIPA